MKRFLPILIIGIFILSGLGVGAFQSNNITTISENIIDEYKTNSHSSRDYTHTVLVEVGTATWCPSCPASNTAWHNIYGSGNYNFEYTELVYDKNSAAQSRFYQFNPKYVPTSYWDGGEYVYPGTNYATFYNYLDASGARIVPEIDADLFVEWLENAKIKIYYNITNYDDSDYSGHLRIYVIELESKLWDDYNGNPYYHAFLNFVVNQGINIPAGNTLTDSTVWDGAAAGFPSITKNNIQVILAVFDDMAHQSYSDPPSGNPFQAYYCDECIAAIPEGGVNTPPEIPSIDGPTHGNIGVEYEYTVSTTDFEVDQVYYWIEWCGEGCCQSEWLGPYPSGEEQVFSHAWDEAGTHTIRVKAKDTYDEESGWGTLEVTMPKNKALMNILFQRFLQRFPNTFPILQLLFG